MTRLATTVGIEYSFVFRNEKADEQYSYQLGTVESGMHKAGFKDAYFDGDPLEVPSPVHKTMASAKKFYTRLSKTVKKFKMTARRIDREKGQEVYFGTGGGHVHVGLTANEENRLTDTDYLTARNMLTYVTNRPWLGWVFNEFMDDWNAKALCTREYNLLSILKMKRIPTSSDFPGTLYSYNRTTTQYDAFRLLNQAAGSKDYALALRSGVAKTGYTMEFRMFDAPRSWKQSREHIEFALAVFNHCRDAAHKGKWLELTIGGPRGMKKFKQAAVTVADFKNTCKELGLSWGSYRKYMKNFHDRKAFGVMN